MSELSSVIEGPGGLGCVGSPSATEDAQAVRTGGAAALAEALQQGRERLLSMFSGFEHALAHADLRFERDEVLNLPLWELGHIGWFEEFWLARNPERARGCGADPQAPRSASVLHAADDFYDSSRIAHARRWEVPLPGASATRDYLDAVRGRTLDLLRSTPGQDDALYFFRLVLFHEDMHREAWHFMAQQLGLDLGDGLQRPAPSTPLAGREWQVPAGESHFGWHEAGFAFDNEGPPGRCEIEAFSIDRSPLPWSVFLPFIESGGYADDRLWSAEGLAWRRAGAIELPLHLRRGAHGFETRSFGAWHALDPHAPATHLSFHEAQAWCHWAGRRLPTEFEWQRAASLAPAVGETFDWGQVWEWTASPFEGFAGFRAHPYRDYSQPWFDGRPVLKGGSFATAPRMKHPAYRNFFQPGRRDVFAGLRSCARPSAV